MELSDCALKIIMAFLVILILGVALIAAFAKH